MTITGTATDAAAGGSAASRSRSTAGRPGIPPAGARAGATPGIRPPPARSRLHGPRRRRQRQPRLGDLGDDPRRRQPQLPVQPLRRARPDPASNDDQAIEVGVRFRADVDGFITGLRYYGAARRRRASATCGREGGTQLASATFVGDSPPAGTRVSLSPAVRVTKDTNYVASFLVERRDLLRRPRLLQRARSTRPPLHAPAGTNGVYKYGGGFPTDSFDATSYGADVLFTPTDQTAPQVTSVAPAAAPASVDPGDGRRRRLRRGRRPRDRRQRLLLPAQRGGSARPRRRHLQRRGPHRHARPRSRWPGRPRTPPRSRAAPSASPTSPATRSPRTARGRSPRRRRRPASTAPARSAPRARSRAGSQSGSGSTQHGSTSSAAKRLSVSPRTVRASKNGTVKLA